MAIQIVMDRTGDSRHLFNSHDAQELAKAEQRFYELTKVGFTAAVRAGPGQVSQIRSFDPNAEETVFFPQAGRRVVGHVRLSTVAAKWSLPQESDASPLHQARCRGHAGGPITATIEKMAVAEPAGAVRQKGLL
ncbi:hypothetical protein ABIF65_006603 [Bradyrhizobium japonicum]|nr:hypothetical protein [Bradyrhizobium japonicum]MCP1783227.1 hypothetical protein [Bradyrhizobium japonicum]MCP1862577.1 hypothetical protein [Bradyrhizobium japonicum]MCP1893432.1 hypothetical protein [Bradyrhizobium japonicum]MCP1964483.1 hypothetical protein [Bradyrhizobium japonicum]